MLIWVGGGVQVASVEKDQRTGEARLVWKVKIPKISYEFLQFCLGSFRFDPTHR